MHPYIIHSSFFYLDKDPALSRLFNYGQSAKFQTAVEIDDAGQSVTFNLIGNSGRIPSRVSDDSAGYTVFSSEMKVIESGCPNRLG